jgi:hypothetical protein
MVYPLNDNKQYPRVWTLSIRAQFAIVSLCLEVVWS